ncbi:hypothetical protein pRALTA_0125 (plasmid) [Cupriavidus taiwanensis LMG 19424]|nr:hypothetical protein pRALTA_0125 [Cupriavidus taiwanensis LMG 19424]
MLGDLLPSAIQLQQKDHPRVALGTATALNVNARLAARHTKRVALWRHLPRKVVECRSAPRRALPSGRPWCCPAIGNRHTGGLCQKP